MMMLKVAPPSVFVLFCIITAVLAAAAVTAELFNRSRKRAKPLLSGLDRMSVGICFYNDNGRPVLINEKMKTIMAAAFKEGVRPDNIRSSKLKDGCSAVSDGDRTFLILPDKTVWDIRRGKIKLGKKIYDECTCYEVTELYGKRLELQRRNAHLSAVNEKIREYSKNLDSMIREKELLDAKIKIHDDVGRALLSLRAYLDRQEKDRDQLVDLWHVTVSVLRRETAPDRSANRMEALRQAAEAVGVTLHFDGEIPDNAGASEITATAVRECLTNTVKHAGGENLYISTYDDGFEYMIKIKNDGKPPDKPIVETGGLRTLRKAVIRRGGSMETEWKNGFSLTIRLDIRGGENI